MASIDAIFLSYTINGKFSNVPSVTRTLTSISINTESGDDGAVVENTSFVSKWLVLTVNFVTK